MFYFLIALGFFAGFYLFIWRVSKMEIEEQCRHEDRAVYDHSRPVEQCIDCLQEFETDEDK